MEEVKILIIGGTGYIGRKLIEYIKINYSKFIIHSIYFQNKSHQFKDVKYLKCDITNLESLTNVLTEDYDYVINMAGYVDHRLINEGGFQIIDSHLIGLMNIIKTLSNKKLKKFIQIGSSDEYNDNHLFKDENSKENPISPYSFSKTASTYFLQMLKNSENFPVVVLRLFLVYGPDQDPNRFIPYIIENCIRNNKVEMTMCEQERDFTYIDDILNGIMLATLSESKITDNIVFNLASGVPIQINKVANLIYENVRKGELLFGKKNYRKSESMRLVANNTKFKLHFNWKPLIGIEEGLLKTINSYL